MAMKACSAGMWEYQLEAMIEYYFRIRGCLSPAIQPSSVPARTLRFCITNTNTEQIKDGDLVLIDAGANSFLHGDVTRTFPAMGDFSDAQRESISWFGLAIGRDRNGCHRRDSQRHS